MNAQPFTAVSCTRGWPRRWPLLLRCSRQMPMPRPVATQQARWATSFASPTACARRCWPRGQYRHVLFILRAPSQYQMQTMCVRQLLVRYDFLQSYSQCLHLRLHPKTRWQLSKNNDTHVRSTANIKYHQVRLQGAGLGLGREGVGGSTAR